MASVITTYNVHHVDKVTIIIQKYAPIVRLAVTHVVQKQSALIVHQIINCKEIVVC